jgi:hypothetical protein
MVRTVGTLFRGRRCGPHPRSSFAADTMEAWAGEQEVALGEEGMAMTMVGGSSASDDEDAPLQMAVVAPDEGVVDLVRQPRFWFVSLSFFVCRMSS